MTGQHTGHTPIRGNKAVPLPSESVTIAEVLKKRAIPQVPLANGVWEILGL